MKAAKSDQVIVTDKNIFKRFKNRLGKNKVNIIYNFTNIEPIHSMNHEKRPMILYTVVGNKSQRYISSS
ncbi:hypothetical protein JTT07_08140 [Clostridium botulinum]|nr:hypothetical protein [Clostridium botulinum]MCS4524037.1 hypothetical protein [Clostridium botulinum]